MNSTTKENVQVLCKVSFISLKTRCWGDLFVPTKLNSVPFLSVSVTVVIVWRQCCDGEHSEMVTVMVMLPSKQGRVKEQPWKNRSN